MLPYDPENIFAKIIRKEIPATIVYEDGDVIAFKDIHPAAPVHVLVLPKKPCRSFDDFVTHHTPPAIGQFFSTIHRIATDLGLSQSGYRLVTNHGEQAGQSVFHFHVHILGGEPLSHLC